ncbi:MAG: hypothetical protein NTV51_09745 [Verrucomicrobia bacterium]|nr:hypothetical protein [Verrucomicrobiota bacterium]
MPDPFKADRPVALESPAHSASLREKSPLIVDEMARIDWLGFSTAYGAPDTVSPDLRLLLFGSQRQALAAAHRLWCGLCHQHAYVSSAAEPALRFLLIGLKESNDLLRVEILDILLGFVVCYDPAVPFSVRILAEMKGEKTFLADLQQSSDKEVAEFARSICGALDNT